MHADSLLDEIRKLNSEMERHFYRLFSPKYPLQSVLEGKWQPYSDVYETEDALVVKMEVAGVKREDLSVDLYKNRLTIRGTRRDSPAGEKRMYHRMEINYSDFERIIVLPESVHEERVKAEYKDGFLVITISKAPMKVVKRVFEIKVE